MSGSSDAIYVDEVRALGRLLKIPAHLVNRHPFPGPGLAIRILGPVTREQVKILQHADSIYIEEIRNAGLYDKISQGFAVLLPVRAVGVQGDKRTYEQVCDPSLLNFTNRFFIGHNAILRYHSLACLVTFFVEFFIVRSYLTPFCR